MMTRSSRITIGLVITSIAVGSLTLSVNTRTSGEVPKADTQQATPKSQIEGDRSLLLEAIRSRQSLNQKEPQNDINPEQEIARVTSFVPNSSVAAGEIISGKDLIQGTLREVKLARGSATLGIDLPIEGGSIRTSRQIAEWSRDNADAAIREVWNAAPTKTIAPKLRYFAKFTHNRREAEHLVNLSGSALGGLLEGGFAKDSTYYEDGTVFIAVFEQINFSASCHSPNIPTDFLASKVTVQEFEQAFGKDDVPCYISDVHYGRYFAIAVRSNAMKSSEVEEIQAGLNLIIAGASEKVTSRQNEMIEKCEVRAVALGGPHKQTLRAMTGNDIQQYLEAGAEGGVNAPSVPVAYTVKNLKDNSEVEIVRLWPATPPPQRVRVTITGFKLLRAHDGDDEEDLDVYIGANGRDLYVVTDTNHWVFGNDPGHDLYAVGKSVEIEATNEVVIIGRVRSRDFQEPDYGEKDVTIRIPLRGDVARDGYVENEQNMGRWKVEYRVEHVN